MSGLFDAPEHGTAVTGIPVTGKRQDVLDRVAVPLMQAMAASEKILGASHPLTLRIAEARAEAMETVNAK